MSIVSYVIHGSGSALDDDAWRALGAALSAEGFAARFGISEDQARPLGPDTPRSASFGLWAADARLLVSLETRDSNEALDPDAWPPGARGGLVVRPRTVAVQVVGETSFTFWSRVTSHLAALLDGWIYSPTTRGLVDADGRDVGVDDAGDASADDVDDDESVEIDWRVLPHPSARPFTIVVRSDRWPSLFALDALLARLDVGFERAGSLARDGRKRPDVVRWSDASYLGSCGESIAFSRASQRYVRIQFDLEEEMVQRDREAMAKLVPLARQLVSMLGAELAAVPIDVEP